MQLRRAESLTYQRQFESAAAEYSELWSRVSVPHPPHGRCMPEFVASGMGHLARLDPPSRDTFARLLELVVHRLAAHDWTRNQFRAATSLAESLGDEAAFIAIAQLARHDARLLRNLREDEFQQERFIAVLDRTGRSDLADPLRSTPLESALRGTANAAGAVASLPFAVFLGPLIAPR